MVELTDNPEQIRERTVVAGPADLVIGLVDPKVGEDVSHAVSVVREGLGALPRPIKAVLVFKSGYAPVLPEELGRDDAMRLLTYAPPAPDPSASFAQAISTDFRAIAAASEAISAKAFALIASDFSTVTPQWVYQLAEPVLERNFEVVTPCYVFHKFETILNNSILYPLLRALYGKRILNPLGPDFGLSSRFLQQVLQTDSAKPRPGVVPRSIVPIGPEAASRGLPLCQTNLGTRNNPPTDWKNLSTLLADVLGPVFGAMERDAPIWQRIRGSEPIPTFGAPLQQAEDTVAVDVRRLLEPFQLGFRNLYEIWALLLPPKTLFELQRLSRLGAEQFRFPDELWVRIIYDFSLGYRLRTISRDHLLRALTPIYLGWIASYALEAEKMPAAAVQHRLERLCAAYEAGKPYLVSRWRWPDRFNP
jgi:glucosylglycerate synthase